MRSFIACADSPRAETTPRTSKPPVPVIAGTSTPLAK